MDPAWVQIVIGVGSGLGASIITGAIWYGALKAWMREREVREEVLWSDVQDLKERVRDIERGPPMDYVR